MATSVTWPKPILEKLYSFVDAVYSDQYREWAKETYSEATHLHGLILIEWSDNSNCPFKLTASEKYMIRREMNSWFNRE